MKIIQEPLSRAEVFADIEPLEGGLVKGVVDVERDIVALDAAMHVDLEQFLIEQGSKQADLWGFNLYPEIVQSDDWIEYDSMINIRPKQGNRSRTVEDVQLQEQIKTLIEKYIV